MSHFRTHEEEGALEGLSLDDFLIENREATFVLRAEGEGMREAGIFPGDLILVDRSRTPRQGDIVLAVEDGEFVLRRFPALEVEAVVTAVIRKCI